MTYIKSIFSTLTFLLIMACQPEHGHSKPPSPQNDKLEALILNRVKAVKEVKGFMRDAKGRQPMLMIDREPEPGFKYYSVRMGISDMDMFRSTEVFCVDPKTLQVYYWDIFADDSSFSNSAIISLTYWRQIRDSSIWQKRHTYEHGKIVALSH